jgi:bifunctional DNase/RNase
MSEFTFGESYRVMNVEDVFYDLSDSSPVVRLIENESSKRRIEIPVALVDAQTIRNAQAGVLQPRPSSSELLSGILERLNATIIDVRIVKYELNIFFAELDVMTSTGRETFDCRSSDGIALALRQRVPAPILCAEELLN